MQQKFKIDLFSDTNSSISRGMREYMCNAEVGNEVAGEDPTVNLLLEKVCHLTGKEDAVFLPSGSMCNTLAFKALCKRPGDGIIFDKTAHPVLRNNTIFTSIVNAQPILIDGHRGIYNANQLESKLDKLFGYNESHPCLVSIENPTNYGGGVIWSPDQLISVCNVARKYSIPTYMDGARLLVAQEKTGIPIKKYAEPFDALFIDFCKSLGAPMGAVLAGSKGFIKDVWFYKFQLGGIMHKAGILAAACIYGLENNLQFIPKVLDNTHLLATTLNKLFFIKIELEHVETNIVLLNIEHKYLTAADFEKKLAKMGIRIHTFDKNKIRIVMHFDIGLKEIEYIKNAFEEIGISNSG